MEVQSLLTTMRPLGRSFSIKLRNFAIVSRQNNSTNQSLVRQVILQSKWGGKVTGKDNFLDCAPLVQNLSRKGRADLAHELLLEIRSEGFLLTNATLSSMMLCFADNGLFLQAQALWEEILSSSYVPSILVISQLMDAYGKMGLFDEITKVIDEIGYRKCNLLPAAYSAAISCFGKQGQVLLMENTLNEMVSKGFPVSSATGNAFIRYYSAFGSLTEMELAYGRLKRSRHLIEEEGIRAMSVAYIKERKFYRLGKFLRDVGLGRKNVGNLLWNLLILSYAANFKMKSMQKEFLRMLEAGFHPDLTTFNIRALAFSRMSLFWDLHLSLEHMNHENVVPDLVTFGAVVDAYMDRRMGKNLEFAFHKIRLDAPPEMLTDPIVFMVLGKGDFHSSSEAFLEFKSRKEWTYRKLVATYCRKQFRRDQIFWNY